MKADPLSLFQPKLNIIMGHPDIYALKSNLELDSNKWEKTLKMFGPLALFFMKSSTVFILSRSMHEEILTFIVFRTFGKEK